MPDESDTALLHVDRGLVRADQRPPDREAQRRAHGTAVGARRARRAVPLTILVAAAGLLVPGVPGAVRLLLLAVMLAAGVAAVLLTRSARDAHVLAGLPVPIEITGKVAPSLRAVLAMNRTIAGQPSLRRTRPAADGVVLLRRWSETATALRGAWLDGDVAAWHEHARTLAAVGERAEQVRAALDGGA